MKKLFTLIAWTAFCVTCWRAADAQSGPVQDTVMTVSRATKTVDSLKQQIAKKLDSTTAVGMLQPRTKFIQLTGIFIDTSQSGQVKIAADSSKIAQWAAMADSGYAKTTALANTFVKTISAGKAGNLVTLTPSIGLPAVFSVADGDSSATNELQTLSISGNTLSISNGNSVPLPTNTGPTGPAGTAASITIGTVTTLAAGSQATATNSGTSNAFVLNLGIPQGQPGSSSYQTTTLTGDVTGSGTSSIATTISSISGTISGGNATAGKVGEYVEAKAAVASAVTISVTGVPVNVTSITLTAGDWDVEANVNYAATLATISGKVSGISTVSATLPTDGSEVNSGLVTTVLTGVDGATLPRKRVNVTSTTTVYLVASTAFTVGSIKAYGVITARRVR